MGKQKFFLKSNSQKLNDCTFDVNWMYKANSLPAFFLSSLKFFLVSKLDLLKFDSKLDLLKFDHGSFYALFTSVEQMQHKDNG